MLLNKNTKYTSDSSDLAWYIHSIIPLTDTYKIKITLFNKKYGYIYEDRKWYRISKDIPDLKNWKIYVR